MGVAYRLVRPQLTVYDVISIRGNSKLRLTTSPFGVTPEQYATNPPLYVGKAVDWKGVKGIDEVEKKNAGVAAGLRRAIAISKKYAGVKGTVLFNGKLYPKKCIEQKKR
jgi:hypothetical protein